MPRCSGDRRYRDISDTDDNPVTGFCTIDINRLCDFMPTAQPRCNHWAPTAWRGVGDDYATIFNWPKHWLIRVKNTIRKALNN